MEVGLITVIIVLVFSKALRTNQPPFLLHHIRTSISTPELSTTPTAHVPIHVLDEIHKQFVIKKKT